MLDLGKKILFHNYSPKISFLSEKDKKNVIRGLQSGVNVLSAGSIRNFEDILDGLDERFHSLEFYDSTL